MESESESESESKSERASEREREREVSLIQKAEHIAWKLWPLTAGRMGKFSTASRMLI